VLKLYEKLYTEKKKQFLLFSHYVINLHKTSLSFLFPAACAVLENLRSKKSFNINILILLLFCEIEKTILASLLLIV
jgi:hypothetical protein